MKIYLKSLFQTDRLDNASSPRDGDGDGATEVCPDTGREDAGSEGTRPPSARQRSRGTGTFCPALSGSSMSVGCIFPLQ